MVMTSWHGWAACRSSLRWRWPLKRLTASVTCCRTLHSFRLTEYATHHAEWWSQLAALMLHSRQHQYESSAYLRTGWQMKSGTYILYVDRAVWEFWKWLALIIAVNWTVVTLNTWTPCPTRPHYTPMIEANRFKNCPIPRFVQSMYVTLFMRHPVQFCVYTISGRSHWCAFCTSTSYMSVALVRAVFVWVLFLSNLYE